MALIALIISEIKDSSTIIFLDNIEKNTLQILYLIYATSEWYEINFLQINLRYN